MRASRSSARSPPPRLALAFAAPALASADHAAFTLLDELLTGGAAARLHRRLVIDTELASSVASQPPSSRDPGLYLIWVQLRRGAAVEKAEAVLHATIQALASEPCLAAELEGARNRVLADHYSGLSSSRGRAEALGLFEIVAGDFRTLFERDAAYRAVTAQAVAEVARRYLIERPHVVALARPAP